MENLFSRKKLLWKSSENFLDTYGVFQGLRQENILEGATPQKGKKQVKNAFFKPIFDQKMPIFKPKKRRRQKIYTKTCVFKSKIVKKLLFLSKIFDFFTLGQKQRGYHQAKISIFGGLGGPWPPLAPPNGAPAFKRVVWTTRPMHDQARHFCYN